MQTNTPMTMNQNNRISIKMLSSLSYQYIYCDSLTLNLYEYSIGLDSLLCMFHVVECHVINSMSLDCSAFMGVTILEVIALFIVLFPLFVELCLQNHPFLVSIDLKMN